MLTHERLTPVTEGTVARPVAAPRATPDLLAWFDGVWIAAVMMAMLFVQLLGSVSALIIIAAVPVFVYVRRERLGDYALAAAVLAIIPGWALLSALWSPVPGLTLYYGAEYLFTIMIGVIMGAAIDRQQALLGLFAAFVAYAAASLLVGGYVDVGKAGSTEVGQAFVGIMVSKNIAADSAGLGMLVSGSAMVIGARTRRPLVLLGALAVFAINVWIVLKAESTGALVAAAIATLGLILMQPARILSAPARRLLLAVLLLFGTVALLSESLWFQPLMETVLSSAGKDQTLTGRTYIWQRGYEVIADHSALGVGYNAFWYPGNPEAEILWDFGGIGEKRGFNFHDTIIEVLVHFGYVGLALFGTIAALLTVLTLIRVTRQPTELGLFLVAYLCFVGVRAPVEAFGLAPFLYSTALITAALAYGLRRRA